METSPMSKFKDKPSVDHYKRVTDQLIAAMEAGALPWVKPWGAGAQILPLRHNGERYHGINVLMLWVAGAAKGYSSPRWMTYQQASDLGGQVRKGEKSTPVVYSGKTSITDDDGRGDP